MVGKQSAYLSHTGAAGGGRNWVWINFRGPKSADKMFGTDVRVLVNIMHCEMLSPTCVDPTVAFRLVSVRLRKRDKKDTSHVLSVKITRIAAHHIISYHHIIENISSAPTT